jgi:hypothetical protein
VHPPRPSRARWTITAFGETKGPTAWSRDRRCRVSLSTVCRRLRDGWDAESAIATAPEKPGLTGKARRPVRAFGRVQSVAEWLRDPRCSVRSGATILMRIERGIGAETAITAPPFRCPPPPQRTAPRRGRRARSR